MQTQFDDCNVVATLQRPGRRAKLWVKKKHLCAIATRLTDDNARQIKKRGGWLWLKDEVDVNSIPECDRIKYGIPGNERIKASVSELVLREAMQAREQNGSDNIAHEIDRVYFEMQEARRENFQPYYNAINAKYQLTKEQCRDFAQKMAVIAYVLKNKDNGKNSLVIMHAAFDRVYAGQYTSKHSFSNFLKACVASGIESKVIDGRAVRQAGKRITTFQYAFLQSMYIQQQKINAKTAARKLAEACEGTGETPYSLSSVKIYYREFENNAELYALRYGAGAAQKQLPYASLLAAEHRNTQWQVDGWTIPFWGQNFQRYVVYLIRDNHSRKIVAYSIAESENTTLILQALDDAMRNTGVFPGELVSDKHSFHKTEISARLRSETEKMGAVWTVTVNAQRNQLAERYNQYLDALCKDFAGYLGKNMTATSKGARPAPEALTEYAKPGNWKTKDEVAAIAAYVAMTFNKTSMEVLGGLSPNEAYDKSESKKAFVISEADRVKLLRPVEQYKVVRGQITIKVGMNKHEFQLPAALTDRYNNRKVEVAYEDLTEGIYVSCPVSGAELGFIAPKVKLHGAIPDQTETDREWFNKLTGRTTGVTTKARKTAQHRILAALKSNPNAIELINTHALPKDIRAMALQDRELKMAIGELGASINNLPIRAAKAAEVAPVANKQTKTKNSPLAVAASGFVGMVTNDVLYPEFSY